MSNTFVQYKCNRQLDNGAAITTDIEKLIIEFVLGKPHMYLQGFCVKIQQNLVCPAKWSDSFHLTLSGLQSLFIIV